LFPGPPPTLVEPSAAGGRVETTRWCVVSIRAPDAALLDHRRGAESRV
jgi:hypothetical protein